MTDGPFSRSAALLGEDAMARLAAARVAVFGTGGVGGWCAEALVRTGVGSVTLVDDDEVAPSNLNRQDPATVPALGRPKVDALRERLLAINPAAAVEARAERFPADGNGFDFAEWDAVVDAIDSVAEKAGLIRRATASGAFFCSSMGAALRLDPTRVRLDPFSRVGGDGLAKALRRRFREDGAPACDFACAHSLEPARRLEVRGSVMPVTAAFGMALAAWTIDRLVRAG